MTRLGRRFGLGLALALASLVIVPAGGATAQETKPGQAQPQKRPAPAPQQARPQQARPPVVVQQSRPQQYQRPAPRQEERRRGPDGRAIAGGVAAGVVGAIILNEATRGRRRGEVEIIEEEAPRMSCGRLADLCDDGERWACRRFSRDCED